MGICGVRGGIDGCRDSGVAKAISPQNILVENGHISGIIDWEQAGWYPEYWEYVKAMWGSIGTWSTVWPLNIV